MFFIIYNLTIEIRTFNWKLEISDECFRVGPSTPLPTGAAHQSAGSEQLIKILAEILKKLPLQD